MPTPPVYVGCPVSVQYPTIGTLPGQDISVVWRPKGYNFDPQVTPTGQEIVIPSSGYAAHEFDLIYNCLRNRNPTEVEFRTLMGFWLRMNGTTFGFLYSNPYDNASVNAFSQAADLTDGTSVYYLLTRSFGYGLNYGVEPIGVLDATQNFQLYANGTPVSSSDPTYGYSVDLSQPWNQRILFNSAPPANVQLAWDMSYYYYCRFDSDKTEFEQVLYNVFQNRKVTLYTKKGR